MKSKGLKVVLTLAIAVILLSTGCLGGDDEEGKGDGGGGGGEPGQFVESPGPAYDAEGWVSSPDAVEPVETEHTEDINFAEKNITKVKITCSAADSDAAHADTDDGSGPDTVEFKISDGGNNSQTIEILTDGTQNFVSQDVQFPSGGNATEGQFMGNHWTIRIKGKKYEGGKDADPLPNIISGPYIIYIDQGIAWKIHVEYSYAQPMAGEE